MEEHGKEEGAYMICLDGIGNNVSKATMKYGR